MAYEPKQLLVALKAFARSNPLPLDKDEIWESLDAAYEYAKSATAYAGQTIKVLVDGKYKTYVLNGEAGAYTLDEVGNTTVSGDGKQYVQVVEVLPQENQEQGVIYITGDYKGYLWNGTDFTLIFEDLSEAFVNAVTESKAYTDDALTIVEF